MKKERTRHIYSLRGSAWGPPIPVGRREVGWGPGYAAALRGVLPTWGEWLVLGSRIARNQVNAVPHSVEGWLQGCKVEARGRRPRQP